MRGLNAPKIKLAKVKRTEAKSLSGWVIRRDEIKDKNRVHLFIHYPGGAPRLKITMTYDEWKEFKK